MTDKLYTGTIDWDDYWERADEEVRADTSPSEQLVLEPFVEFLETRLPDGPESYADVGCGPGALAFAVDERYPSATVVGYDAAPAVLAENRERAAAAGRDVAFERGVLPGFDPDRQFEVVSCVFTLCYVADVEAAVRDLYDVVAPGGYLVIEYHNRLARAHFRRMAADPHEHLGEDAAWDPESFTDRFELVIEGESLLSYDRIHEVLGRWPQSLFSVADDADQYEAHRYEPLVFVPK